MYIATYLIIPILIFSLYGFICIAQKLLSVKDWKIGRIGCTGEYGIIIFVKDQQDTIEALIRSFIMNTDIGFGEGTRVKIGIVDKGSKDDTPEILQRIVREFPFIKLIESQKTDLWLSELLNFGDSDRDSIPIK